MTNATLKLSSAALRRAADWLEQNRDKHIIGFLALDGNHREVEPFDPKAECFCGYGRYMLEMGQPIKEVMASKPHDRYEAVRVELGVSFADIYERNDRVDDPDGPHRGSRDVLTYMRRLADEHDARS